MGKESGPSPEFAYNLAEMKESKFWNMIPPGINGVTIGETIEQLIAYNAYDPNDTPEVLYRYLEQLERERPTKK